LMKSGICPPVIYITGNDSDTIRKAAIDSGCVAYLTKPFPAIALVGAIEKATTESFRAQ
jgi:CheY-like chemotaxis protein